MNALKTVNYSNKEYKPLLNASKKTPNRILKDICNARLSVLIFRGGKSLLSDRFLFFKKVTKFYWNITVKPHLKKIREVL